MHTSYPKIANKIIEWGIIFLIVFTPLAFASVHPWAYTVMELTICFLVIIWILKLIIINLKKTSKIPARIGRSRSTNQLINKSSTKNLKSSILNNKSPYSTTLVNRFGFVKTPLIIPIVLFVGLVLFQLAPLPPGVLKFLSPNTYQLYKTTSLGLCSAKHTSPGPDLYSAEHTLLGSNPSIPQSLNSSIPQSSIQSWHPLSVYPYATKTELYKILAYIGIFFLIINYNPSTRSRQPVTRRYPRLSPACRQGRDGQGLRIKIFITRLIIILIVVGCFESIYGLLECLSGHQHIFFRKKILGLDFASGTYINRNHFAGYMAIVICMSFGYLTYILSKSSVSNVSLRVRATGWRQRLSQIINLIGTRAGLLSFLILIMSSALILSGSRAGICSFIIVIILMSTMISKRISIKKITLILLPVCLMVVWIGLNPVIKRFSETPKAMKAEGERIIVWKDTYNLIKDFPTLGTGLGTYEYAFPKYKTIRRQVLYNHTHNDYLELMSDTGITGFFIVIAGAAYYLFMVIRLWFQRRNRFVRGIAIGCLGGITYIILHSLTDFNLQIPANALHLSIITGIMHKTITQL
ncbi:MAG TPA: O-antigen ligase domain-containing protein [Candidatus Scalindua sp.]|nr:O-antigen ligase domain-containing protein [Candidatus Scalindua sp.]